MPNLPSLEERIQRILELTAEEQRPCKACNTELYFVRHSNGKLTPYTKDGVNHFQNCTAPERFRRRPVAKQLDFSGQETSTGTPQPAPDKKTKVYETPRRLLSKGRIERLTPEQQEQVLAYKIEEAGSNVIVKNVEAVRLALGEKG